MRVLVVCTGNTHRSPACQLVIQALDPTLQVVSGGVGAGPWGRPVALKVRRLLQERGWPCPDPAPRSRKVLVQDIAWADCILFMQPSHRDALMRMHVLAYQKLVPLATYAGQARVPDLAFLSGEDLVRAFDLLVGATRRFVESVPYVEPR